MEVFEVTDDHPWYVETLGWVETKDLRAGQRIETADDRGLEILEIARTDRMERTYNLTVEGLHTFLVGEDGAVVHNCQRFFRGALRKEIFAKKGTDCKYCGKPATQIDHINPYSRGGPTTYNNGNPACASCNASKGARQYPGEWP